MLQFIIAGTLLKIVSQLNSQNKKLDQIMNKVQQLEKAFSEIDEATTEIGNDLEALRAEIAEGNVTQEHLTRVQGIASRLKAMGQDPSNPDPGADTGTDTGNTDSGNTGGETTDQPGGDTLEEQE